MMKNPEKCPFCQHIFCNNNFTISGYSPVEPTSNYRWCERFDDNSDSSCKCQFESGAGNCIDYDHWNRCEQWRWLEICSIGSYKEDLEVKEEQNELFLSKEPEIVELSEMKINPHQNIIVHLMQIHSLKGLKSPRKDKVGRFLYFVKQFWDNTVIDSHGALCYEEQDNGITRKLDEFIDLSLKRKTPYVYFGKPKIIIFPENSIPYSYLEKLIDLSSHGDIIIIGGLEHKKTSEEKKFINQAFIIEQGKIGYQIKQTPVIINDSKTGKLIMEPIVCEENAPDIKIFQTSVGKISIFICKDFLRLYETIPHWTFNNNVDYIIVPSLTSKVLPFFSKMVNIHNDGDAKNLVSIFCSIGEYGGSEIFSVSRNTSVEEDFRIGQRDNLGETIVLREFTRIKDGDDYRTFSRHGKEGIVYDLDEFFEYVMENNPKIETIDAFPVLTTATGADIIRKIKQYLQDNNKEWLDFY